MNRIWQFIIQSLYLLSDFLCFLCNFFSLILPLFHLLFFHFLQFFCDIHAL